MVNNECKQFYSIVNIYVENKIKIDIYPKIINDIKNNDKLWIISSI